MRIVSILLIFAFVLAGSSVAGIADDGLPGVGTFAYDGSLTAAGPSVVVAAR